MIKLYDYCDWKTEPGVLLFDIKVATANGEGRCRQFHVVEDLFGDIPGDVYFIVTYNLPYTDGGKMVYYLVTSQGWRTLSLIDVDDNYLFILEPSRMMQHCLTRDDYNEIKAMIDKLSK